MNYLRPGLRCGFEDATDLYASIQEWAGSGSTNLGDISTFLLNAGLGIEAARNALNTVAANVGSDPQRLAAINAELNYLNSGGYIASNNNRSGIIVISVAVVILWLALREK
jgi:hypothetical protein